MIIKAKSLIKGAASNFIPSFRVAGANTEGAFNAEGSYAIFMRFLLALDLAGSSFDNRVVVEFGPGLSFGVGLCALLCGAKRYYAFDLVDHTTADQNIIVLDELCDLLKSRAPIQVDGWYSRLFPFIDDPAFPSRILTDAVLKNSLDQNRIEAIRRDLKDKTEVYIRPRSSADVSSAALDEPADIIISESVLEHVDDLEGTYAAFDRWLAPEGVMAHLVDYDSHNLTTAWNGHWQCSPGMWSIVRGKRAFLINRVPHHGHLDLLERHGMQVVHCQLLRRADGVTRDKFDPEFAVMDRRDATTALASIVSRRR